MWLILLWALALGTWAAEVQFWKPVNGLSDLVVTDAGVAIGTADKVIVLDETGKISRELPFPGGLIQALAWHKEKGILAAGGWNLLRLWKWPSGEVLCDISGFGTMAKSLAFSPDLLLCGGADGRVLAFDLEGKLVWTVKAHEGTVWGVAAVSGFFATAGSDRAALWEIASRKEIFSFPGRAWDVAFSPNGFSLAAGAGKILKIWDTAFGLPLLEVWAHESCTVALAFSPNGKYVATGSLDQTVALWDAESGALLRRITGFPEILCAVAFSLDGKRLWAGAADGTVALIPIP